MRLLLPAALAAVPIAVTVACYGPTEVTVILTTDLPCEQKPRTAIYKGVPFAAASAAETESCTPVANADANIGSLVFLPSGDENGRAGVKAVLARGRSVAECGAHPEDCIVATRSFSFVEHLSRKIPIRMLTECLGKVCPEGTTCGPGRVCIADQCTGDDCGLPGDPVDGGPPAIADGGSDADAAPPSKCLGPNGTGVIAQVSQGIPPSLGAAFTLDTFFYLDPSPSAVRRIMSVTVAGGAPVPVFDLPGPDGVLIALTTFGKSWLVAHDRTAGPLLPTALSHPKGSSDLGADGMNPVMSVATALENARSVAYVARATNVEKVDVTGFDDILPEVFFAKGGGSHIEVDGSNVYLSGEKGIDVIDRATAAVLTTVPIVPANLGGRIAFAKNNGTVYAAGVESGTSKIVAMQGTNVTKVASPDTTVISLATDATHVYFTDGSALYRTSLLLPDRKPLVIAQTSVGEALDHVAIDNDCVYYWRSGLGFNPPGEPKPSLVQK